MVRNIGLTPKTVFLLTLAFAFATVAPAYTRHTNSHILFLGVAAPLMLVISGATRESGVGRATLIGLLAGLGYTLDLGIGPPLVVCVGIFTLVQFRRILPVLAMTIGILPGIALHHILNFQVGGTIVPANAIPEYLQWPGSPFSQANMTGGWKHTLPGFLFYAGDLLIGNRGFLLNNFPLWLVPIGAFVVWNRDRTSRIVLMFAILWPLLGWLAYSATSNNRSGQCCSIRWFVPFLAPGFWVLAHMLKQRPEFTPVLAWLSGWGVVLASFMWWSGPWAAKLPFGLLVWVFLAGAGAVFRVWEWKLFRSILHL